MIFEICSETDVFLELKQMNSLFNDPIIESFQEGRYVSEVRETIMSLVTEFGVSQKRLTVSFKQCSTNLQVRSCHLCQAQG